MGTEPVAISTAIKEALSASLKLLVIFSVVAWSAEQFAGIMLAVDSLLAVILLIWQARSKVTSLASPRLPSGTDVTVYNPATGADTGTVRT
jgi:hypothetical protein